MPLTRYDILLVFFTKLSFIEFMARCLLNHFLAVEDYKFLVVEDYYLLGVLLPLDYIRILSLFSIFFLRQLTP